MTCPYCKVDYTFDDPCFCHPPSQTRTAQSEPSPAAPKAEQRSSPLEPTGLNNPFWKA